METRHLQIFVAVYRTGSFTKAAEELFTSQPTVSEHIQNLESRLNCRLFDRLGRTIMPTAEAEVLYPRAVTILEDLQQLEQDVLNTGKKVAGELIIGASTIPGTYILPGLAAAFKTMHPQISFEIRISDSAEVVENLVSHKLLIGFVGAKIGGNRLHYHPIAEDELLLVASPEAGLGDELTLQDLKTLPFITREVGSGTRKVLEQLLGQNGCALDMLQLSATLGSSAAVKEAVKANLGVSAISRCAVQEELQRGTLQQIKVEGLTMSRSFYLVAQPKRSLPPQYRKFVEHVCGGQIPKALR